MTGALGSFRLDGLDAFQPAAVAGHCGSSARDRATRDDGHGVQPLYYFVP
jgi:hypothetical protein